MHSSSFFFFLQSIHPIMPGTLERGAFCSCFPVFPIVTWDTSCKQTASLFLPPPGMAAKHWRRRKWERWLEGGGGTAWVLLHSQLLRSSGQAQDWWHSPSVRADLRVKGSSGGLIDLSSLNKHCWCVGRREPGQEKGMAKEYSPLTIYLVYPAHGASQLQSWLPH